jgi:hypothetical protein
MARAMKTSLLSFVVLLLVACGSSEDTSTNADTETESSPTVSACEAAGTRLCARACACATDGKCRLGVPTDSGNASINFDDAQGCLDLYVVLGCLGGGEPGFDYSTCESAVETSSCVATAGGQGFLMPKECQVTRK